MALDLTAALQQLTERALGQTSRQDKTLPPGRDVSPIPPRTGTGGPVAQKTPASAGIASPLTETAYADRTFHAETLITSTDGIFTLKIKPVESINFTDASGASVVLLFKEPA